MQDLILRVLSLLDQEDEFIVPVRKLYRALGRSNLSEEWTEEAFLEVLKGDERFRVFEAPDEDDVYDDFESEEELEALGFYRGPRVMRKDSMPTREDVLSILVKKADKTFSTLHKAWDIRPDGDEETEDQLLEALAKAQRLKRELQALLDRADRGENEGASGSG